LDEASSKYVDQIATQRLINDKLKKVHHAPDHSIASLDTSFRDFKNLSLYPEGISGTKKKLLKFLFDLQLKPNTKKITW